MSVDRCAEMLLIQAYVWKWLRWQGHDTAANNTASHQQGQRRARAAVAERGDSQAFARASLAQGMNPAPSAARQSTETTQGHRAVPVCLHSALLQAVAGWL